MLAGLIADDICDIFANTRTFLCERGWCLFFTKKGDYSPLPALVTSGGEYLLAHAHTRERTWGRTTYYHVLAFFYEFRCIDLVALWSFYAL